MDITIPGIYRLSFSQSGKYLLSFDVNESASIRIFLKTENDVIFLNRESIEFDDGLYLFDIFGQPGNTIIFQVIRCKTINDVVLIEANQ